MVGHHFEPAVDSNALIVRLLLQIMTLTFRTKSQNSEPQHVLVRSWARNVAKPLLSISKYKRRDKLPSRPKAISMSSVSLYWLSIPLVRINSPIISIQSRPNRWISKILWVRESGALSLSPKCYRLSSRNTRSRDYLGLRTFTRMASTVSWQTRWVSERWVGWIASYS